MTTTTYLDSNKPKICFIKQFQACREQLKCSLLIKQKDEYLLPPRRRKNLSYLILPEANSPNSSCSTSRFYLQVVHIYLLTISLCCISVVVCDVLRGEKEGYYAFEEAPSRFMKPPQVRKPPYMMSSIPCPTSEGSKRPSPKYTLCGDLNKGYIPLNPLNQEFEGQPYPFELIKNKTLVFLSKALPYLKQDPKIPKVSKISAKKPTYAQTSSNSADYQWQASGPYRARRSANESTNGTSNDLLDLVDNETTARQNCDQGGASGIFCTLTNAMSNNKIPLALISAVAQSLASSMGPSTPAPQEYTTERPASHHHTQEPSDTGGGGGR
ncbi:uncharacterized protein CDAR_407781 [Caerostris darwini]|uniref:Uncharacterized protein n=1 Tax=Caerostris darwini TaxID=1538125 RepID=A0AAV4T8C4_9ARAC|nr:uncharacterized protein CDAR_407781 [Caerostris darwini]